MHETACATAMAHARYRRGSKLLSIERNARCHVDRMEALRYLGYGDQELTGDLARRMEYAFARCEEVACPSWSYQMFDVDHRGRWAVLSGSALSLKVDGSLAPLANMAACAVMCCTIGFAFDRELNRMSVMESTEAVVLDAAGSSLAETCADACERAIREKAAALGLHAGQRTSPGYGDLPLDFSREIIRVLEAGKRLGVSMSASGLLVPAKSVTAIVGLFECEGDARRARRSCADCVVRDDCAYLRAGNPCNAM